MTHMASGLELKLDGRFSSTSGEVLIIDPALLVGFDFDRVKRLEEPRLELEIQIRHLEMKPIKHALEIIGESEKGHREKRERTNSPKADYDPKKLQDEIAQKKRALRRMPSFAPPYIAQADGYVCLGTGYGDGCYPVTETQRRFHVEFNFPVKQLRGTEFTLDRGRLNGKYYGTAIVDSGTLAIIDKSRFRIDEGVHSGAYSVLNLPQGQYSCRFIDGTSTLSINKSPMR